VNWQPYLELQCLDCGDAYPADRGDCPSCGSANCSYDSDEAKRYADECAARDDHYWDEPS
jgi:rRNA maturation endonuclease Nob1